MPKKLYEKYIQLHDYFGRKTPVVMKELKFFPTSESKNFVE